MSLDTATTSQEVLDDLRGRFLTFNIDDTLYGIELLHIIEIISVPPIAPVPGLPHYFKGIINLRGKIAPVIDVRLKFCQEERPYDDKTCIIVVSIEGMQVGLIVDCVAEVITVDSEHRNTPPDLGTRTAGDHYLSSIARVDGKVVLNIDCDKFFQNDLRLY